MIPAPDTSHYLLGLLIMIGGVILPLILLFLKNRNLFQSTKSSLQ
jgi:hypothetical protein